MFGLSSDAGLGKWWTEGYFHEAVDKKYEICSPKLYLKSELGASSFWKFVSAQLQMWW